MPQKRTECFKLVWIEHQFLSGIRDSRKAGSLWVMMRSVAGVRKSIYGGLPEVVGTVQQVHCSRRLLQRRLGFHFCTINKSAHTEKSLETYLMILVLRWIKILRSCFCFVFCFFFCLLCIYFGTGKLVFSIK